MLIKGNLQKFVNLYEKHTPDQIHDNKTRLLFSTVRPLLMYTNSVNLNLKDTKRMIDGGTRWYAAHPFYSVFGISYSANNNKTLQYERMKGVK